MESLYERSLKVLTPAASRATHLGVTSASGCYLYTEDGRKMLDFAAGVSVCNVGHNNPDVVKAAIEQTKKLIHAGHNVVYYESYVALAEKLVQMTGGDTMVYFSNSGAEANEGAIKLAKYVTRRPAVIAFKGSFHGRTMGTLSVTCSSSAYRKNYEGLMPSVYFADYPYCYRCPFGKKCGACSHECMAQFNDIFMRMVDAENVAAILVEPEQGEGGYIVPDNKFMRALREICVRHGICLIFDEVQTGFGRTGKMFAYQSLGVKPDIMTCAKGIAGGFPLSAVIGRKSLMEKWPAGAHGGTFGGNPVACAAALASIKVLENGVVDNCAQVGVYLLTCLEALKVKYPVIGDVRGMGVMCGMEFVKPDGSPDKEIVKKIIHCCLDHNLVILSCGTYKNVIRFMPPLIVTKAEIDTALAVIEDAIKAAVHSAGA